MSASPISYSSMWDFGVASWSVFDLLFSEETEWLRKLCAAGCVPIDLQHLSSALSSVQWAEALLSIRGFAVRPPV